MPGAADTPERTGEAGEASEAGEAGEATGAAGSSDTGSSDAVAKEQKAAKELARKAAIDSEVDKYSSKVGLVFCFSFCCLGCEEGGSEEPRDPGLHW